jgi:hypothetical protein
LLCHGDAVPPLAFSPLDLLLVLGLGAAGFLVVALVCAIVLAVLQVVLPSTDAGAAEIDRLDPPEERDPGSGDRGELDSGGNA